MKMTIERLIPCFEEFKTLETIEKIYYIKGVTSSTEETLQKYEEELKTLQNYLKKYTCNELIREYKEDIKTCKEKIKETEERLEFLKIIIELFKE